jgi:hypothetical protein
MEYSDEVVSKAPAPRVQYMAVDVMGSCRFATGAYLRRTLLRMEFESLT